MHITNVTVTYQNGTVTVTGQALADGTCSLKKDGQPFGSSKPVNPDPQTHVFTVTFTNCPAGSYTASIETDDGKSAPDEGGTGGPP